jgi:perosamine synthetase
VLLPAFHCTALVEPFLAYGCRVLYYPVGRDLALDFAALDSLARGEGVKALLYIHFFGLPGPSAELKALCALRKLKLIEDCTHTLFSWGPTGSAGGRDVLGGHGDVSVFSFRKILGVEDGGALVLPRPGAYAKLPKLKSPLIYHVRMLRWTLDRMMGAMWKSRAVASPAQVSSEVPVTSRLSVTGTLPGTGAIGIVETGPDKGPDSHEDPAFVRSYAGWAMSWPSRWLLAVANPGRVARKRRRNYLALEKLLKDLPGLAPLSRGLGDGLCPMGYPFLAVDHPRLDYALRKRGVPAFSFGETLHAGMNAADFPDAVFLSGHLVLLPVHQGLTQRDLEDMARAVKACLS